MNFPFGKNQHFSNEDIRLIAKKFPYSLPVQALLSKNLKDSNKLDFNKFLKISSVISPDRTWLYNFVNSNKFNPVNLSKIVENKVVEAFPVENQQIVDQPVSWINTEIIELNPEIKARPAEIKPFDIELLENPTPEDANSMEEDIISEALEDSVKVVDNELVVNKIRIEELNKEIVEPVIDKQNNHDNQLISSVSESALEKEIMKVAIDKTIQREVDEIIAGELSEKNDNPTEIEEVKLPDGFNYWLNPVKNQVQSREEKLKKIDALIEKFIKSEPRIVPKKVEFYSPLNVAKQSVEFNEDLVSEPLAAIFEKQGYFDKAIKAYEKLSLKFPEKRTYFATRIEKIKEIIKNIKNTK